MSPLNFTTANFTSPVSVTVLDLEITNILLTIIALCQVIFVVFRLYYLNIPWDED